MPVQQTITLYRIDELDGNAHQKALKAFYRSETFREKQQELKDDIQKLASDLQPYKVTARLRYEQEIDGIKPYFLFILDEKTPVDNPIFVFPMFWTDSKEHPMPLTRFYEIRANTGNDELDYAINNAIEMMEEDAEEIIDSLEDETTDEAHDQLVDEAKPLFKKLYSDIYLAVDEYVTSIVADWNNESVIEDIAANMLFTAEGDLYEE